MKATEIYRLTRDLDARERIKLLVSLNTGNCVICGQEMALNQLSPEGLCSHCRKLALSLTVKPQGDYRQVPRL